MQCRQSYPGRRDRIIEAQLGLDCTMNHKSSRSGTPKAQPAKPVYSTTKNQKSKTALPILDGLYLSNGSRLEPSVNTRISTKARGTNLCSLYLLSQKFVEKNMFCCFDNRVVTSKVFGALEFQISVHTALKITKLHAPHRSYQLTRIVA
jgi:hypothetical protein